MSTDVGSVSVKVMPSMAGFASQVDKDLSGAGSSSGSRFGRVFSAAAGKSGGSGLVARVSSALSGATGKFSATGKATGAAFSSAFSGAASANAVEGLQNKVKSATLELRSAMATSKSASLSAEAAQVKYNDAVAKYGPASARALSAESNLVTAKLRAQTASERAQAAESKLASAQKRLASATSAPVSALGKLGGSALSSLSSEFGSAGTAAGGNMASKVASGFSAKAAVIAGAVAGVVQRVASTVSSSVDAAVARVDTLNNFPKVLQSLGYGADESQRSVDTLSDRLSELPTRLDAAATGVQQLAPSSKSIDQATDRYLAFNDAVLAGGASEDIQSNAMTQLTKAVSTNKMEMDTWMSIQQAMPGQLDQVAKSMLGQSASASDLYQAMKDGRVTVSDFADAVVDLDKNGADGITSFSEQAKAATGGIKTSFSNMCNAFPKGVAKIIGATGRPTSSASSTA